MADDKKMHLGVEVNVDYEKVIKLEKELKNLSQLNLAGTLGKNLKEVASLIDIINTKVKTLQSFGNDAVKNGITEDVNRSVKLLSLVTNKLKQEESPYKGKDLNALKLDANKIGKESGLKGAELQAFVKEHTLRAQQAALTILRQSAEAEIEIKKHTEKTKTDIVKKESEARLQIEKINAKKAADLEVVRARGGVAADLANIRAQMDLNKMAYAKELIDSGVTGRKLTLAERRMELNFLREASGTAKFEAQAAVNRSSAALHNAKSGATHLKAEAYNSKAQADLNRSIVEKENSATTARTNEILANAQLIKEQNKKIQLDNAVYDVRIAEAKAIKAGHDAEKEQTKALSKALQEEEKTKREVIKQDTEEIKASGKLATEKEKTARSTASNQSKIDLAEKKNEGAVNLVAEKNKGLATKLEIAQRAVDRQVAAMDVVTARKDLANLTYDRREALHNTVKADTQARIDDNRDKRQHEVNMISQRVQMQMSNFQNSILRIDKQAASNRERLALQHQNKMTEIQQKGNVTDENNERQHQRRMEQIRAQGEQARQTLDKRKELGFPVPEKQNIFKRGWNMFKGFSMARFISPLTAGFSTAGQYIANFAKQGLELSDVLRDLQVVTGASRGQMDKMRVSLKEIASSTGKATSEVAKLSISIARLGVGQEQIAEVTKAAVELSLAVGGSAEEAGNVLVQTMNAFGISYEKAEEVATKLAQTSNSSAFDINKLKIALGYVSTASESVGVSFEKTAAILAMLTKNGLSASQAGTSLRNVLSTLVDKGTNLDEVLKRLKEGTITYADATEMVGKRSASAFKLILENMEEVDRMQDELFGNIVTASDKAYAAIEATWTSKAGRWFQELLNDFTSFFASINTRDDEDIVESLKNSDDPDAVVSAYRVGLGRYFSEKGITGAMIANAKKDVTSNAISDFISRFDAKEIADLEAMSVRNGGTGFEAEAARKKLKEIKKRQLEIQGILEDTILDAVIESQKSKSFESVKKKFSFEQGEGLEVMSDDAIKKLLVDNVKEDIKGRGFVLSEDNINALSEWAAGSLTGIKDTDFDGIATLAAAKVKRSELMEKAATLKGKPDRTLNENKELKLIEEEISRLETKWGLKNDENKSGPSLSTLKLKIKNLMPDKIFEAGKNNTRQAATVYRNNYNASTNEEEKTALTDTFVSDATKMYNDFYDTYGEDRYAYSVRPELAQIEAQAAEYKQINEDILKGKLLANKITKEEYDSKIDNLKEQYDEIMTILATFDSNVAGALETVLSNLKNIVVATTGFRESKNFELDEDLFDESNEAWDKYESAVRVYESKVKRDETNRKIAKKKKKTFKSEITDEDRQMALDTIGITRIASQRKYSSQIDQYDKQIEEADSNLASIENKEYNLVNSKFGTLDEAKTYYKTQKNSAIKGKQSSIEKYRSEDKKLRDMEDSIYDESESTSEEEKSNKMNKTKEIASMGMEVLQSSADLYKQIQDQMLEYQRERIEKEIENEKEKNQRIDNANKGLLDAGIINNAQYAERKRKLEQDEYEKSNKLMEKQFNAEKKAKKQQATIDYAISVANIAIGLMEGVAGMGVLAPAFYASMMAVMTGLATGQYAAKMAAINKEKYVPQKYEDGGYVTGASHADGGIKFSVGGEVREMEGGEYIVNRSSTAKYRSLLESINNDTLNSTQSNSGANMAALIEALDRPVRAYIVSADIGKDNKYRTIVTDKTSL